MVPQGGGLGLGESSVAYMWILRDGVLLYTGAEIQRFGLDQAARCCRCWKFKETAPCIMCHMHASTERWGSAAQRVKCLSASGGSAESDGLAPMQITRAPGNEAEREGALRLVKHLKAHQRLHWNQTDLVHTHTHTQTHTYTNTHRYRHIHRETHAYEGKHTDTHTHHTLHTGLKAHFFLL